VPRRAIYGGRAASIAAAVLIGAGCGGVDRDRFVTDANEICSERQRAEAEAVQGLDARAMSTRVFERELVELRELEPPEEDRARYAEMLRLKRESLSAWKGFVAAAERDDFEAGEPLLTATQQSAVRAARIAGRLGLDGCSRALS